MGLKPPDGPDDWVGLDGGPLPVSEALSWVGRPSCGAVVLFTGNVRDHGEGRSGVSRLEYETYDEQVVPRLAAVAAECRRRWPVIGRLVLLHRKGDVDLGEPAVVVVASAPHRAEAFDAARFCIDTLKATVPIWKREVWDGGEGWVAGGVGASGASGRAS